jgi:hypothetical protein
MIKDFYLEATVISNHVCDGLPVSGAWGRAALTQHATRKERSGVSNSCQTSGRKRNVQILNNIPQHVSSLGYITCYCIVTCQVFVAFP